jgi:hypothetical protein
MARSPELVEAQIQARLTHLRLLAAIITYHGASADAVIMQELAIEKAARIAARAGVFPPRHLLPRKPPSR